MNLYKDGARSQHHGNRHLTTMKPVLRLPVFALLSAVLFTPGPAPAAIITSDPNVPPGMTAGSSTGFYLTGPAHPFFNISGGNVTIFFDSFQLRTLSPVNRTPSGADEVEQYPANASASGDVFILGTGTFNDLPSEPVGAGAIITRAKAGLTTGTFVTEMLQMDLNGSTALGPYLVRESPTLQSLGSTTVTDIGGGLFRIDSFFDVFTEISIDGGVTWTPDSNGPARLTLLPEPGSMALAGIAGLVLLRRRR
jgi:MYXO-CTERM domain-containing protein